MKKIYVGIDNGVTGTIGIIWYDGQFELYSTPVKTEQSYTKKKQNITRIDFNGLGEILELLISEKHKVLVLLERPFVNPGGFKATISAIRALEATLIVVENCGFAFEYVDSKQWQNALLPSGLKGAASLKKASLDIGLRLFPNQKEFIQKHGDADGLLIAEWARRKGL